MQKLSPGVHVKRVTFKDVPIGAEFWWGGYIPQRCNWGRKRSSRTADWCPLINGKLDNYVTWGYWKANETVYILP